ncbi:diphthine methyltransferase, putative [Plasmodium malariae]|uniref:methylated diphthine methylhydrolase n=1 Tax=Plasmodium malariae TaxID=5858 RepID=A0A1C3KZX2_PLAMA|nr:diphthine methyltransferase, putative [Plasmodium malariae]
MIKRKYNVKYCCDDICVFPSSTMLKYNDNKFCESFGLTAVSTYQLKTRDKEDEKNNEQKKKGKVFLFRLKQITNEDNDTSEIDHLLIYEKDINFSSGVLQSNYLFTNESLLLGSVCVNGFHLSHVKDGTHHQIFATPDEKNNSGLSFDAFNSKPEKICVSFSNGDMCFLVDGNEVQLWKAHEYHVWACTFNGSENVVTTGSDDCSFIIWDLRTANISQINKRSHSQGVTAVKFEDRSNLLYTASYDNKIRTFDLRNIQDPLQIIDVKSSIWRIKFLYKNEEANKLLVAACDGGAQIFKKLNNEFIFKKGVSNDNELTYGIDAIDIWNKKKKKKIYFSCSFYNKEIQMWV